MARKIVDSNSHRTLEHLEQSSFMSGPIFGWALGFKVKIS